MNLVLCNGQGNKNAYKTLIAAKYCGVKVRQVNESKMSDDTHLFLNGDVFCNRNRLIGKVPVLETPDGPIVESNAMARYVAMMDEDKTLFGVSAYEIVQIEQWMAFATTKIDEVLARWIFPRIGVCRYNALSEHVVVFFMKNSLGILNTHFARGNDYLVGDRMTLADIVLMCDLYLGFTRIMTKTFTSEFPLVEKYFWKLVGQQKFKEVLGEVKQVESLPVPVPKLKKFLGKVKRVEPEMEIQPKRESFLKKQRTNQETDEQEMEAHKAEGVIGSLFTSYLNKQMAVIGSHLRTGDWIPSIPTDLVLRVGIINKRDAYKTLITAKYCGLKVVVKRAVEKVCVLETVDGPVIEGNSMARYIALSKGDLYPSSVYECARVEEWVEFAFREMEEGLIRWIHPNMGLGPCDPDHCLEMRIAAVRRFLRVLNTHLGTERTYLVGDCITLADIAMTCALHFGFTRAMTKTFTSEFPNVERYFWKLINEPNFKICFGEVKQVELLLEWPLRLGLLDRIFVDPVVNEQRMRNQIVKMEAEEIDEESEDESDDDDGDAEMIDEQNDGDWIPSIGSVILHKRLMNRRWRHTRLKG